MDALDKEALAAINGYNPGLSGAWMLQRAMSIQVGQKTDPAFINKLLSKNFAAMKRQGPATLRPFLQVGTTLHPRFSSLTCPVANAVAEVVVNRQETPHRGWVGIVLPGSVMYTSGHLR